jgi:hypothetical protein
MTAVDDSPVVRRAAGLAVELAADATAVQVVHSQAAHVRAATLAALVP